MTENGHKPDGPPEDSTPDAALKAAMREVLEEIIPLIERRVLEQMESRTSQAAAALAAEMNQKLTGAVARIQAQVNEGLGHLEQPADDATLEAVAQRAPGALGNPQKWMTLIETVLDSAGPKLLNMMIQMKAMNSPWLYDMQAVARLKQDDPFRATLIGQTLMGPNPYEPLLGQALLNGAAWGLRVRQAATNPQGGSPSPLNPATLLVPAPGASSSGAPLLPGQPGYVPPSSGSNASMTSGPAKRLRDVLR